MTAHVFTFFISYVYKKSFNIASVIQTMERDAIYFLQCVSEINV